jgi:hypothetical protein
MTQVPQLTGRATYFASRATAEVDGPGSGASRTRGRAFPDCLVRRRSGRVILERGRFVVEMPSTRVATGCRTRRSDVAAPKRISPSMTQLAVSGSS